MDLWHTPLYGGLDGTGPLLAGIWRWSYAGNEERVRDKSFVDQIRNKSDAPSAEAVFDDVFLTNDLEYQLRGWNPEKPQPITPIEQMGVRGYVNPRTDVLPSYLADPATMLLTRFRSTRQESDQRRNLSSLARTSLAVTTLDREGDDTVIGLRFIREKNDGNKDLLSHYDVFLDPQKEFLATKVIEYYPRYQWYGESGIETIPVRWVREVVSTQEGKGGVFFPIETTLSIYRDDREKPTAIFRAEVTRATINENLPEDALNFKFPENLLVQYPPSGGRNPVKLWGANNLPVADIESVDDLNVYAGLKPANREGGGNRNLIFIALNIVVVCLSAVFLFRKYRTA
jgi:hypothetical protein